MNLEDIDQAIKDGNRRITKEDAVVLFKTADDIKPQKILEIGSADGGSSIILGTVAKHYGGTLQCVEPSPTRRWKKNMEKYELLSNVELLPMPSPWVDTIHINSPVDYLFIDGCHKLKWVITDYQWGQFFVRHGGRIAFHDWSNVEEDVTEAVEIILRTDDLKLVDQVKSKLGIIVLEKP